MIFKNVFVQALLLSTPRRKPRGPSLGLGTPVPNEVRDASVSLRAGQSGAGICLPNDVMPWLALDARE
jgi:hypothetical protein